MSNGGLLIVRNYPFKSECYWELYRGVFWSSKSDMQDECIGYIIYFGQ